jgi:hypothetical protein
VTAGVIELRDIVQVHVTADLPIRTQALPFADRVEIRFGKAFPVALIVDRAALDTLAEAITEGRMALDEAANNKEKGVTS